MDIRFGNNIPVPTPKLDLMFEAAQMAEKCGFESLWFADHLSMIPAVGTCYEAFMFLTALALKTQKAKLCSAVSDPHRRHPVLMAQTLASLDVISNGRVMFGIGAGEAMNLDMYGFDKSRPVSKMEDYIEIMRRLWKEDKVTYESQFYNLKDAFLQVKPVQENIPIYIAGNGPRTRQLTGRIGDGWFPLYESPKLYEIHLKEVEKGAKEAGRGIEEIDTVYFCYTAVAEDFDTALNRVKNFKVNYLTAPQKVNAAYGLKLPKELSLYYFTGSEQDILNIQKYLDDVPDIVSADFNIIGTLDQVMDQIEAFIKAGVRHFSLLNRGPDPNKVYETYRDKIIPYFKEQYSS
ncbi:MAG: LLM class flavin-dependent oxidoreductase [Candidatus Lokiarchaeia archaeon]